MQINKRIIKRVKYLGEDNPLALRHGKEYNAIVGDKGLYCIVDETGEEYAFSPCLFVDVEVERK